MDIHLNEKSLELEELMKIQRSKDAYKGSYLDQKINYISVGLLINSGDELIILCESVDYSEEYLDGTKCGRDV